VTSVSTQAILRGILSDVPKKYQNPKLQIRHDVARSFYFIRVFVPSPDGKRKRIVRMLGFVADVSKKEAEKRRAEVLDVVNAGRILIQAQVVFREVVGQFVAARLPRFGTGTRARYLSQIENHILPAFGEKRICDITRLDVEAWLTGKEQAGLSWWTREGLRGIMASIFAAAKDWNLWSGDSPTIGVRIGRKRETREKRIITADQLRAVLAAVSEQTRFMILIGALMGLRISEICGLRWGDIDFTKNTLTVKRRWYRGDLDEPKTQASERERQLGPLVQEFQRRYPGPQARDKYIFTENDGSGMPVDEVRTLGYELRPALKRLGLYYPGFGWHAFRRLNVTWRQTIGGATPLEAQKAAGHASLDMSLLYTLNDAERERDQVQAMFDKLMATPQGKPQ